MRIAIYLLTSIFWLLSTVFTVRANSEFTTSFHSEYTVKRSGESSVIHRIALKNKVSHIYATSYTLATSGDNLKNLTASDEHGQIPVNSTVQNGVTTISMKLDRPTIGLDQVKTLTISYQTDDVVEIIGDTLTINIPRLARANEAEEYIRVVRVEDVESLPKFIYPPQNSTEPDGPYLNYTFVGHQNDSLTLLFGDSVTYKLNLVYELRNKELGNIVSELALPPDTGYQRVILSAISPEPMNIVVDDSGNWLARYSLKPQEKLMVTAEMFVTVYPTPTLYDPSPTKLQKTPHSKYWQPESSSIKDLANQLKTPGNIYNYLVDNFSYNYTGINSTNNRLGAQAAITSPANVLCTEFTDSFVALARSLEIPARAINGYGYTKNNSIQPQNTGSDILHAWPEFYDHEQSRWIAIDPTWGNTTGGIDYFHKLDFSHITFVRLGDEDSYPLPAGAYKSSTTERSIEVGIAEDFEAAENYEVKSLDGKSYVYNTGNIALVDFVLDYEGEDITIEYLPPFGQHEIYPSGVSSIWSYIKSILSRLATWANIR